MLFGVISKKESEQEIKNPAAAIANIFIVLFFMIVRF